MRTIWKLVWPTVLYNLLEMTVGFADLIMVRSLGTQATAAVSVSRQVTLLIEAVAIGITAGATILVSHATGAGDGPRVRRLIVQSMYLVLVCGSVSTCIGLLVTTNVLHWLHMSELAFEPARAYLTVYFAGLIFSWFTLMATAVLRGKGDVMNPLKLAVGMNLLNVAFNYVFIHGIGPLPANGVAGAAMGTVLARACAAACYLVLFYYMLRGPKATHQDKPASPAESFTANLQLMWQIVRLGLPLGGAALLRNAARLVYLGIVGASMGTALQAAVAIGMQVRLVAVVIALAFQVGLNTLVGQALGRRNVREAQFLSRQGIALLSILMLGITLLLFLFSNTLASWLLDSPAAAAEGGRVLRWFALAQLFSAVSIGLQGILMGRGDTAPLMRYTMITQWLVLVPLAFACSYFHWTPQGVLAAWMMGPLVMVWLLQWRVRRGVWLADI